MWSFVSKIKQFVFKALGREGKPTGKPQKLTPKAQEKLASVNLEGHAANLVALTKQATGGKLSVKAWQEQVKATLKNAYLQSYLLGIGGKSQMDAKGRGSCGGMLAEQYKHLKGFADELAAGKVSPAQAERRIQMYVNSAREGYERARSKVHKEETEECWKTSPDLTVEHCADCLRFEAMGWQKKGTFPYPGQGKTVCLTSCCCTKLYR